MSYILEALKKSDKERQRDEIPDIQADHSLPPLRREERKRPVWPTPKVVILGVACIAALLWWQLSSDSPAPVTETTTKRSVPVVSSREVVPSKAPQVPEKNAAVVPVVEEKPIKQEPQVIVPRETTPALPVAAVIKKKPASPLTPAPVKKIAPPPPASSPKTEVALPPLMEDLPVPIRAGIPDLTFAGHVYSEAAEKRLIIINNRIVREGDLISSGLSLKQIDPDGVVLQYEASVFRVKLF
jgi:general secretion pathway protein B